MREDRRARTRRAYVLAGRATLTNLALSRALSERGLDTRVGPVDGVSDPRRGDLAIGRLDVLPSLDGVESGLWRLPRLERDGVHLLNGPLALLAAHDKLSTALLLARVGIPQPRTAHVREARVPHSFASPYVVKPRFGSWGNEVVRCDDEETLLVHLHSLEERDWFRRHGALVQECINTRGRDLRLVVAGGRVVGAIERHAAPGEWRTNVAQGARRRSLKPPAAARVLALRAAAAVRGDLVGVDLISDADGRFLVLEVNGAVDFTTEYGIEGCDPFEAAVDALLEAVDNPIEVEQASTEDQRIGSRAALRHLPISVVLSE